MDLIYSVSISPVTHLSRHNANVAALKGHRNGRMSHD